MSRASGWMSGCTCPIHNRTEKNRKRGALVGVRNAEIVSHGKRHNNLLPHSAENKLLGGMHLRRERGKVPLRAKKGGAMPTSRWRPAWGASWVVG